MYHTELYIIHNKHTYLQSGSDSGRIGGSWWFRGCRGCGRSGSLFDCQPDVQFF